MSRTTLRPRLGIDTLERRDVPAIFNGGILTDPPLIFDPPPPSFGNITFANGTITATGTESDDVIKVHTYEMVFQLFRPIGDVAVENQQTVVTITDAAGNVRTDANGAPLQRSFNASSVTLIQANGLGGNDRIVNLTNKLMTMSGGEGNDTLQGGPGNEFMNGGNGHDLMHGGAGNDVMMGMGGNDRMSGEAGSDTVQGGDDFDIMNGGDGNDNMDGEGGTDIIVGGAGDDTLMGWDGNDVLSGEAGNDRLRGNRGNDYLSGGIGRDVLYGGEGNDDLEGGADNDGLFGGSGKDTLNGGTGIDRFLKWVATGNTTRIEDFKSYESLTQFKDTTTTQTFSTRGVTLRYQPAAWTETQIEQVDGGLEFLHTEVGNTRMLKRSGGGNVTMLRYGAYMPYNATDGNNDTHDQQANTLGPGFTGFNRGNGNIWFGDGAFTSAFEVAETTIHELAHNWDDENGKYTEWKSLSGWRQTNRPNANETLSRDGNWVYSSTAEFFRDYGRTNPKEDFATSFEAYYRLKLGLLSYADLVRLTPKLNFIGLLITRLGQ